MRSLVLGAGRMGRAVAYDLCQGPGVDQVTVADSDPSQLLATEDFVAPSEVATIPLDITSYHHVLAAMEAVDVAVSCVPYRYNYDLARTAIKAGCDFCDLGGNSEVVSLELALGSEARDAGVTIVPDCGLAPGMATMLAADAATRLDRVDELHIRVGGLPLDPRPPLDYMLLFDPAGLVNEYREPCQVLRGGRVGTVEPLEDLEEITFPEPFGTLEAFNTSGGTSTLPRTMEGRVRDLDYKTVRYRGHCERMRLLRDAGLFDEEPVPVDGGEAVPRRVLEALLLRVLPTEGRDVTLVKVWAKGTAEGRARTLAHTVVDMYDDRRGHTSMQRTTAFPASIVAQMIASGGLVEGGVTPQELLVPTGAFLEELARRGIRVETVWD